MTTPDPDRVTLYDAENRLIGWIDRGEPVRLDGTTWIPEADPLFATIDEVAHFCAEATARLGVPPVSVRARRGATKAEYVDGEIRVPPLDIGGAWAMRGLVVMHELAHHLAHTAGDPPGHGPAFRTHFYRVLHDLGLPSNARLLELAHAAATRPAKDWTATIGKLLAKAESTSNAAEAETFAAAAQELATRHAIDLALAREAIRADETPELPEEQTYPLGKPGQRWLRIAVVLYTGIARVNEVSCFIASNSTAVYPTGFPSDIAMTNALFESLRAQMVRAANAWIATGEYKQEVVVEYDRWGRERYKPMHASTARKSFYEAFVMRVLTRLREGHEQAVRAWADEHAENPTGAELALLSKREKVAAAHEAARARLNVRGSWRGASTGVQSEVGRAAGTRAGSRASVRPDSGRRLPGTRTALHSR
ncbi:DUF2786 domain-containing protein [Enemella sp. A6]|uniref:DUF2786 domain-containing protein n=1 Tax=Enemella sp. A6 TaxID=3440152 RepID=UPI003EBDA730